MTDFINIIDKIEDKQEFVQFVELLNQDLRENPNSWENITLGSYLEAISSWTEDMDGYYKNMNIDYTKLNQWQIFANILVASKVYE
jgi:hypothetical protein